MFDQYLDPDPYQDEAPDDLDLFLKKMSESVPDKDPNKREEKGYSTDDQGRGYNRNLQE